MRRQRIRISVSLPRQDDIIALHKSNHILELPIGEHANIHMLNYQSLRTKRDVFTLKATVIKLSIIRAIKEEISRLEREWKLHIKYEIT